jgi:serine/threonine protein kinase
MGSSPDSKPNAEDIASLFRLGLEEPDSAALTPNATLRGDLPTPRPGSGKTGGGRGWSPPSIEELQAALPQYEITKFIAHGGMGAVYKGTQKTLKRTVAIKVLPPEMAAGDVLNFADRFKREAQAMARLSHPNIVAVFDAGETPDVLLYFVMEFIEGTDVAQLIASERRLDADRAVLIIAAVCEALAFAHEEGIVHRDIKPSNIMIDKRGRVKVADFGLAKVTCTDATLVTQSHVAMGTPDFIAPEAMLSGISVDGRADIYAVGVMLYQMLTGIVPRGRFELPSGVVPQVDKRFDTIVDKAMQADRDKRYSTASEMKKEVERVAQERADTPARSENSVAKQESQPAAHGNAITPVHQWRTAALARAPIIITATAILLVGTGFLIWKKDQPPTRTGAPKLSGVSSSPSPQVPASSSPSALAQLPVSIQARAIKLWDTPEKVKGGAGVKWENHALRLDNRGLGPPKLSVRDVILRASILANPDAVQIKLHLRNPPGHSGNDTSYLLGINVGTRTLRLFTHATGESRELATWQLSRAYGLDEWVRLEFRAIGDVLTVIADGQVLGSVRDGTIHDPGSFELYAESNGYFRDISYIPLDGLPEAEALKLAGVSFASSPQVSSSSSSPGSLPSGSAIPWHDWLAETEAAGTIPPELTKEAGGWRIKEANRGSGAYARFIADFGSAQLKDAAIRVTYVPLESDPGRQAFLSIRTDSDRLGWRVGYNSGEARWVVDTVKNRVKTDLLKLPPMPELLSASREPRTIELRMVGDTLSFYYNGTLLDSTHDATPATGKLGFSGPAEMLIQKVEWADFQGVSGEEVRNVAVSSAPIAYPPGQWIPVWPAPKEIPNLGSVTEEWVLSKPEVPSLRVPGVRLWNGGLRARFRADKQGPPPQLMLRDPGGGGYNLINSSKRVMMRRNDPDAPYGSVELAKFDCQMPGLGEPMYLEFLAVGRTLIARVNGETFTHVLTETASPPVPGDLRLYQVDQNAFRDVEILNLDGLPEAEALRLAGLNGTPTTIPKEVKKSDKSKDMLRFSTSPGA